MPKPQHADLVAITALQLQGHKHQLHLSTKSTHEDNTANYNQQSQQVFPQTSHAMKRMSEVLSLSLCVSLPLSLSLLVGLVIPQSQRSISSSSRSLRRWYSLYWMRQWR